VPGACHIVFIVRDDTYVASYHTTTGHYAVNDGYFATAGFADAPLQALEASGRAVAQGSGQGLRGDQGGGSRPPLWEPRWQVSVILKLSVTAAIVM
jgi:hypothetical protein